MRVYDERKKNKEALAGDILLVQVGDEQRYFLLSESEYKGEEFLLITDLESGGSYVLDVSFDGPITVEMDIEAVDGYIVDIISNEECKLVIKS